MLVKKMSAAYLVVLFNTLLFWDKSNALDIQLVCINSIGDTEDELNYVSWMVVICNLNKLNETKPNINTFYLLSACFILMSFLYDTLIIIYLLLENITQF